MNGLNFNHYYQGGLHSGYVRGEALLAAHRYPEAAAEFQKILDHRGIVGADPIGALAVGAQRRSSVSSTSPIEGLPADFSEGTGQRGRESEKSSDAGESEAAA